MEKQRRRKKLSLENFDSFSNHPNVILNARIAIFKRVTLGFDDGNARESSIWRWRGEKMESRDGFTRETRFDSVRFDDLAFSLLVNAPQIRICPASTRFQPFLFFSFLFFFFKQRHLSSAVRISSRCTMLYLITAFHRSDPFEAEILSN